MRLEVKSETQASRITVECETQLCGGTSRLGSNQWLGRPTMADTLADSRTRCTNARVYSNKCQLIMPVEISAEASSRVRTRRNIKAVAEQLNQHLVEAKRSAAIVNDIARVPD